MEKAWAKVHGSYKRIESGTCDTTFRDVYGAPAWIYKTSDEDIDHFKLILEADQQNFMMAASCTPKDQEMADHYKREGLVGGHTYGLIAAKETTDKYGNTH